MLGKILDTEEALRPSTVSLKGAPGKYVAIGYGIVQLCFDHDADLGLEKMAQYQQSAVSK